MRFGALIVLLLLALPAWAAEDAGQVMFVAGDVSAERAGGSVVLRKTNPVYEGDIVVTASRSRGQLLMRDGAKYALRPDTRFSVIEYFMAGDQRSEPDGSLIVSSSDGAVTELIKGGFRAITGAIDPNTYELETVAATMGIRGTKFSVVWCAGDCELPPGSKSKKPILDGLYVGVSEGAVSLINDTGEFILYAGEYTYVRDRQSKPVRLSTKPVALIDTFETDTTAQDDAADELIETFLVNARLPPPSPPQYPHPHCPDAPCPGFKTGPLAPVGPTGRLPVTGSANFTVISGKTDPVDTLGNTGVLGHAALFANFSTGTVDSAISLNINGNSWHALGSGGFTDELFSGSYAVCIDIQCSGTSGDFSGFFGANGSDGVPASAGLTYGLTNQQGVSVSGSVVFGPQP